MVELPDLTAKKGYLTLPSNIVNNITRILMKRRGKNMPQFLYDQFDGDEEKTKFWLEEQEGEWKLMSHYGSRPFNQEVLTAEETEELMRTEGCQAISMKSKIMSLFRELGCSPDEALNNAIYFMTAVWEKEGDNEVGKRMLAMFVLMKEADIVVEHLAITQQGGLMLGVKEQDGDKMRAIHERLHLPRIPAVEEEEINEDPSV